MILKYKTPCSFATHRPDSALLCLSQNKKGLLLFYLAIRPYFILINHVSPFLSDTHFLSCDYWLLGFNPFYFLNLPKGKSQQKSRRVRIHKKMLFFKKALKFSLPSDEDAYVSYTAGLNFLNEL